MRFRLDKFLLRVPESPWSVSTSINGELDRNRERSSTSRTRLFPPVEIANIVFLYLTRSTRVVNCGTVPLIRL